MNDEDLPSDADIDVLLKREAAKYSALMEALRLIHNKVRAEKATAQKVCAELKPKEQALMKTLCKQLADAHATYTELWNLQRSLINNGVALKGICNNVPYFLGVPTDSHSELAAFFRLAVADKLVSASSLPKGLIQ